MKNIFPYVILVFVILIALVIIINNPKVYQSSDSQKQQMAFTLPVIVTEESLSSYLAMNQVIQDLPTNAAISLRTSSKEYVITRGKVVEGKAASPDVTISIPSTYITEFSNGFCSTLDKANKNKDLAVVLHSSQTALAWKYRTLYKYRECFGLWIILIIEVIN